MTHKTLKQRADEVAKLQESASKIKGTLLIQNATYTHRDGTLEELPLYSSAYNNLFDLYSAAPRMAQLIREQQERIEELEEGLSERARLSE